MFWPILTFLFTSAFFFIYYRLKLRKLKLVVEREKMRADFSTRKDFFEHLLNSISDPIFMKNEHHQWIYGNHAFSKILGMEPEVYLGKSDYEVFPKEMADVFWAKDNETLQGLKVTENEELILADGEVRTILTKKSPIVGDSGTVLIGVIRDITQRKKNEETIRNLYQLIEVSSDLYCICNLEGKPTFINQHGQELGLTLNLNHFSDFFKSHELIKHIDSKLSSSHQWEGEIPIQSLKTGETLTYWLKVFIVTDQDKHPHSIALVGTNIQERKETQLKLMYTSKMASLGEMAGGIAHEINNPLAIISGKAEQLKKIIVDRPPEPAKVIEALNKIEDTAFRISKIIRGLKSFSRAEDMDPMKTVVLSDLVEETLDLCRERMKSEKISIVVEVEEGLKLRCKPTQIQQVLINLLNNSTDAIRGTPSPWIRLTSHRDGQKITLTVTDSGHGIDIALKDKIMTPFFTTKEVGKGTGLGLSISKGIMELHQGQLIYEDKSPNTAFSLIFNT